MNLDFRSQIFVLHLKRVSSVLVYLSLFFIQLSGILFAQKEDNSQASFASWKKYQANKQEKTAAIISHQNSKAGGHKCLFRPSKRFHPESGILFDNYYSIPGEITVYTAPERIGYPTAYLLFTVILARTMRGPPVVA